MAKVNYEGPEQFRPLGAWEYFGYSINWIYYDDCF